MNLDLTINSLIIFLFIIFPGIVFRRFYFLGEFTKQFNSKTWTQSLLMSFIPGLFIQLLTFYIFINLPNSTKTGFETLNFNTLSEFYNKIISFKFTELSLYYELLKSILIYLTLVIILSAIIAQIFWHIVRSLKLDCKYKILRFDNFWNYYFKGEIKDFKEFKGLNKGKVILVKADVLLKSESTDPILYSGILSQYTIKNKTNELENIYLTECQVWKKNNDDKHIRKDIQGDCMIIPNKNILNINLNYIWEKKTKRDLTFLTPFFWLISIIWILATKNTYFRGETLLRTILLKIFFMFFSLIFLTFIDTLLTKTRKKNELKGLGLIIIICSVTYYIIRFIIL
jgi:hypothetical protein